MLKIINPQVDPETARYARMVEAAEEATRKRLAVIDRQIWAQTIARRRMAVGWIAGAICAGAAVCVWWNWNSFWAGVGAAAAIGCGASSLVAAACWASEVEP